MDAKVNYTVVGLIGTILIAALIFLLYWMSHEKHEHLHRTYVSYFTTDVTGLNPDSKVRLNGINVGYVKSITLDKSNYKQVEVILRIDEDIPITTHSYTVLESEGLTGSEYVALKSKKGEATPLKKKPGEKYPVIPTKASLLTDVEGQLKVTSGEIKTLVARANDLLKQDNREAIDKTLANIEKISQAVAKNSDNIDKSLVSIEKILKNTDKASQDFPAIAKRTVETLESIEGLAHEFTKTGQSATHTLSKTNVAIQNMADQLLPTAQQLILQLNQMISTFNQFGQELSNNPSMLIRGKYPSPPGPGEK